MCQSVEEKVLGKQRFFSRKFPGTTHNFGKGCRERKSGINLAEQCVWVMGLTQGFG